MKLDSLRATVTDQIVRALENGVKPWTAGWDRGALVQRPLRHNGTAYRGINVLLLWISATEHGFTNPYWMTYRQAAALGGQVRKGSRGTPVIVYKPLPADADEAESGGEVSRRGFSKVYSVFNANQIDGLPTAYHGVQPDAPAPRSHDALAAYSALMDVHQPAYEEGPQPCYIPSRDVVRWPDISVFHTPEDQLATVCHELAHWTGSKDRLARDGIIKSFDKQQYAYEELVADLAAAFMGATFGILGQQLDNHASYIGSWIKLLSDPAVLFKAAAEAERACDFLLTAEVIDRTGSKSLSAAA